MAYCEIEELSKLIKKMGDGFYKIKVKKGKIEVFWLERQIPQQELEEILKKEG